MGKRRIRVIRVLMAKPGLDGHDRGAKVVARALRNAGLEVIYTGLHQPVEDIVEAALEEDVDVIGLSILSGAHVPLCRRLMAERRRRGLDDVAVVVGGSIPSRDVPVLYELGVSRVFRVGSPLAEITEYFRSLDGRRPAVAGRGS